MSSISFVRGILLSKGTAKEKGKTTSKPSNKEDKSLSLTSDTIPTEDTLPAVLAAYAVGGVKAAVALNSGENAEVASGASFSLTQNADKVVSAYVLLRGVPLGMGEPGTPEEEYRNKLLILALARAVLLAGENYRPDKVPNTYANASALRAVEEKEEAEAARKAKEEAARKAKEEAEEVLRKAAEREESEEKPTANQQDTNGRKGARKLVNR